MNPNQKHGGYRPGAGRKRKPKTTVLTFRIREDLAPLLKPLIKQLIVNFSKSPVKTKPPVSADDDDVSGF